MESMIMRVAKALEREEGGMMETSWEELARAAIEAMREPTEEQIDAGVEARGKLYEKMEKDGIDPRTVLVAYHPAGTIYQAMIDAALKEQEKA